MELIREEASWVNDNTLDTVEMLQKIHNSDKLICMHYYEATINYRIFTIVNIILLTGNGNECDK